MALTGTFEDVSFAELLQLLNVGHRSGRLHVSRGDEWVEMHVCNGELAWAHTRFDRGPEVIYRVLGWQAGEFRFERSCEPVMREITESTEALILEGMKRFDEWEQAETTEEPEMHVILRQCAGATQAGCETLSEAARRMLRLVNARRTVAALVRESGLEPRLALTAVMELQAEGLVEEWGEPSEAMAPVVLRTRDRLPEATGGIQFQSISQAGSSRRAAALRPTGGTPRGEDDMGKRNEPGKGASGQ